ncbi:hypothetical protein snusmum91_gp041 [Flavobacterium phage vB_FspS_snusmum9-1]|nr:hypothetical protein snusmum91_gp041 [Flavobacterium phage vB_FspS_snusmum9-1]
MKIRHFFYKIVCILKKLFIFAFVMKWNALHK